MVVVLGRFFDVAPAFEQKARDGMHDAGAVGAGKGEYVSGGHVESACQRRVRRLTVSRLRRRGYCRERLGLNIRNANTCTRLVRDWTVVGAMRLSEASCRRKLCPLLDI